MRNDFELVVHKLGTELTHVNVYPIGDLHIGSGNLDMGALDRWVKMVEGDPNAKVVIVGDMIDNGLKTSRTNSYEATMQPFEQKQFLLKLLEPIKDKILGAVQGNHEARTSIMADMYPLYDVLAKLDIENVYRQNMAFLKINLGQRNADRQCSYTMVLSHGGTKNKVRNFGYAIDGMDIFVTGHNHQPDNTFPTKLVIDSKNESVTLRGYTHITVPSFQQLGGYTLSAMYQPQSHTVIPVIRLDGEKKYVTTSWL